MAAPFHHDANMAEADLPKHPPVFFFDIDNCLYPRSAGIQDHMQRLIGNAPLHSTPKTHH